MGASADLSLCTLLVRSHLRIDVVCRGPVLYHSGVTPDTPDNGTRRLLRHGFRLGDFDVRPLSGEVSGPDGITTLRPEVMEVLLNLAAAKGDVVDEDQLAHAVWGSKGQSRARLEQCIRELQDCLNSGIESLPHVRRAIEGGYHVVGSLVPYDPERTEIRETAAGYVPASSADGLRGFVRELRRRDYCILEPSKLVNEATDERVRPDPYLALPDLVDKVDIQLPRLGTTSFAVLGLTFGGSLTAQCGADVRAFAERAEHIRVADAVGLAVLAVTEFFSRLAIR